jgi:hypothetical protein
MKEMAASIRGRTRSSSTAAEAGWVMGAYRQLVRSFVIKFLYYHMRWRDLKMHEQLGAIKGDLSGSSYCVAFNCRKAARAVTRLYDLALTPSGIRSTQFAILVGVAKSRPVSIGRLSKMLLLDATTLTRSLQVMRRKGLLRISERSIMRQRFVTLTRWGKDF